MVANLAIQQLIAEIQELKGKQAWLNRKLEKAEARLAAAVEHSAAIAIEKLQDEGAYIAIKKLRDEGAA